MNAVRHRFADFVLDTANRSLLRDGQAQALNARYFDALALLVREHGRLVGKQRFFDEVWTGSVVTDAALTQCIKDIRRLLGDDASAPRFVRTVPGHGYCFIAPVVMEGEPVALLAPVPLAAGPERAVERASSPAAPPSHPPLAPASASIPTAWIDPLAATAGGALAGLLGGLLYGSALAFSAPAQGLGSLSVLLVLLVLNMIVGMAGALGVGLGLSAARRANAGGAGLLAGGALGGFVIGGLTKLLGSDAFTLIVGHAPSGTTGALEGAAIGLALAAGLWAGGWPEASRGRRPVLLAGLSTGLAGALLPLAGGSMMASSLARIAAAFEQSRLDMAPLARWFGDAQFGPLAQSALGSLEGGIFGACVAAALLQLRKHPR